MYLRCVVQSTPTQWTKWLSLAELWYNTSFHYSLKCSPFKALYGNDPPHGVVPSLRLSTNTDVTEMLIERQAFSELLKEQLARA
jgi:hypothetical protein